MSKNKKTTTHRKLSEMAQKYGFLPKILILDSHSFNVFYEDEGKIDFKGFVQELRAYMKSKTPNSAKEWVIAKYNDPTQKVAKIELHWFYPAYRNKFFYNKKELRPKRATFGSAGYDFVSPKDFTIPAHGISEVIDTEVSVQLETNYVLMCYVRSSFGFNHSTTLVNGTGIIDRDFYPNTIKCKFRNDSNEDLTVHKGDKIMQGIFIKHFLEEDEDTSCMTLRIDGFGSTGK